MKLRRPMGQGTFFTSMLDNRQFGLVMAYVVPGFVALTGLTPIFPAVSGWLQPVSGGEFGLGPPLYAVLAATGTGLVISCFRWLFFDQLFHWTGVRRPDLSATRMANALGAMDFMVQNHYRYHEFAGNMALAGLWSYVMNRGFGTVTFLGVGTDLGMVVVSLVLFAASRDALRNYYKGLARAAGPIAKKESR